MRITYLIVLAALAVPDAALAAFECYGGDRAACLGWGDKVCSSGGKCVDDGAVCFEPYTCDFKGFVCKSSLDRLSDDYDELLRKAKLIASDYDDQSNCVRRASTIAEAQQCIR